VLPLSGTFIDVLYHLLRKIMSESTGTTCGLRQRSDEQQQLLKTEGFCSPTRGETMKPPFQGYCNVQQKDDTEW